MSKLELQQVINIINKSHNSLDTFPQYQFKPSNYIYKPQLKELTTNIGNKTTEEIEPVKYLIDNRTKINTIIINRYQLTDQYYIYGIDKRDSFIRSLLYIIDNSLINYDKTDVDKFICSLRNKMGIELDKKKYYQIYNYRKYKYKKDNISDTLLNNKIIEDDVKHYLADYFKVNIIVINSKLNNNYRIINEFSNIRGNCYLLEFENNIYQPILNDIDSIQYTKSTLF